MLDDDDRRMLALASIIGALGMTAGIAVAFTAGLMWRVFQLAAG